MKTFIKWPGNKSKHINKFIKYFPTTYNTYIEPFVGSGAVLLKIKPSSWIINDLNKDLINIWIIVKDEPEKLIKSFKNFGNSFKTLTINNKLIKCRKLTEKINKLDNGYERSFLILLMKFCTYGGTINIRNRFYFQSLDTQIINNNYTFLKDTNYNNILQVSDFLNETNGKIYNRDYKKILKKAKKGDFIFMDPPYIEDHDYHFNYNEKENLNNSFILDLYKECKILDNKNVKWLMTQANTKEIRKIFKEYTIKTFEVYRIFKKEYVKELVIFNY